MDAHNHELWVRIMKIDAHVHYMPPELKNNLAEFTAQEPYWGLLLPSEGKSVQGWASTEQMLSDMDRAGLDKVVLQGEYFQRHENCVARNSQAIALVKQYPDRMMAFAVIQPKAGVHALDELKRCLDNGLCGVGELNPYAQGYPLNDPDFYRLVEACIAADIPLNLHVSEEVGPHYPGKSNMPLRHYYNLAERYPALKLILAHWGGGLVFYEAMPKVRAVLRNVWYDTAASPLLYDTAQIFPAALHCVAPHKLLYGSDYPLRLYPRRQKTPDFHTFMADIAALNLDPAHLTDIMGRNAARLLGLLPADTPAVSTRPVQDTPTPPITSQMAVVMVARAWPETRAIFEQHGIPWQDSPVPPWEPIAQAAAARGYTPTMQTHLLEQLNTALQ